MPTLKKTLRTCKNNHQYYKSSDCPVCPICETAHNTIGSAFSVLVAPARRALKNASIVTPEQLSTYSEKELLKLHGIGPSSIPIIKWILHNHNLALNDE